MPPKAAFSSRVTKLKLGTTSQRAAPVSGHRIHTRSKSKLASLQTANTTSLKSSPSSSSHLPKMPTSTTPAPSTSTQPPADKPVPTKPVYFWQPNDGNGYLGQWFWSGFTVDGDTYATAEMWMMVQKARLFQDEDIAKQMLDTTDPKLHKALGRKVKGFDDKVWDEHKLRIVEEGNYHKFAISDDAENLRGMLMATGERELVEASPRDRIWGVGFAEKNACENRHKWGENLLGKALVNVRERLRKEEEAKDKRQE